LLFDDVELQVLFQPGEWAAPGADRNRDRCELVFIDEAAAQCGPMISLRKFIGPPQRAF
jgi:hypothetical protein